MQSRTRAERRYGTDECRGASATTRECPSSSHSGWWAVSSREHCSASTAVPHSAGHYIWCESLPSSYSPMNHAFTNAALRPQIAIGNIPIAHPLGGRVSFHHGVGGNINLQQQCVGVPNPNPNPNPPLTYPNMPSIPPLNVNPPAQNSLPRPPLIGTWICCNIQYEPQKRRC